MLAWKKVHTSEDLDVDKLSDAQVAAFAIAATIDFSAFIILESKFNTDKLDTLRKKFNRPSHVAEYVFKKFKGDLDAMERFITEYNKGTKNGQD